MYPLIDDYILFKALTWRPDKISDYENEFALNLIQGQNDLMQSLRQFNLFAFVLHDPETHSEFDNYLSNILNDLDRLTGDRLLMFVLVNPDETWMEERMMRSYHKRLEEYKKYFKGVNIQIVGNPAPSATAYSIAWALGISPDDLPVIIFTEDLNRPDFMSLKTSISDLKEQAITLGKLAKSVDSRAAGYGTIEDEYLKKKSINLSIKKQFGNSLADSIQRILSIVFSAGESSYQISEIDMKKSVQMIRGLFKEMTTDKPTDRIDESSLAKIDENATQLSNLLSLFVSGKKARYGRRTLDLNRQFLEPESLRMLETVLRVLDFMSSPDDYLKGVPLEENDFSPAAICFAKFLEREINLSFVHWIRFFLGVSLPKYFDKYQPDRRAVYIPDNLGFQRTDPVDFNARRMSEWKAPMLGQSKTCLLSLSTREEFITNFYYVRMENMKRFLRELEYFNQIRVRTAHPYEISKADVMRQLEIIDSYSVLDIFSSMYEMKNRFRGVVVR